MLESLHQTANALRRRPTYVLYERIDEDNVLKAETAPATIPGNRLDDSVPDSVFLSAASRTAALNEPRKSEDVRRVVIASAMVTPKTRGVVSSRKLCLDELLKDLGAEVLYINKTFDDVYGIFHEDIQKYGFSATRIQKGGIIFQIYQLPETPEKLRHFTSRSYRVAAGMIRAAICRVCDEKPVFALQNADLVVAKHYEITQNYDPRLLKAHQHGKIDANSISALQAARDQHNLEIEEHKPADQPM